MYIQQLLYSFYQKYYLPPVNVVPENRVFSLPHIIISAVLFFFIYIIFKSVITKRSENYSKKVLLICAWSMLLLEIFRIAWNAYFHGFSITSFRFDFCNQICMFLPFCVIFGNKKIYPYIQLLAIVGGLIVLIYPLWVFYDYAGFHLLALQSMVSHALMLICGLVMPFASGKIPDYETGSRDTLIGFSVILVIAFIMSKLTGQNYLMMNSANGVPLLSLIPYPWYLFVFLGIAFYLDQVLTIIYQNFLCVCARLPLGSTEIYSTPMLNNSDYIELLEKSKKLLGKALRPIKYNNELNEIKNEG